MDFASLMSSEISKAKPPLSPTTTSAPTSPPPKKYLKRADLEAQRLAAYHADQLAREAALSRKAAQKRRLAEEESSRTLARDEKRRRLAHESSLQREEEEAATERDRRKRLGLPELPSKEELEAQKEGNPLTDADIDIPEPELVGKLRALGEPAILFGESHKQRLKRYYLLTRAKPTLSTGPIPTTLSLLPESEMRVPSKPPPLTATSERAYLFRQLASYFTLVLIEWELALSQRPEAVKTSFQGRQAEGAYVQSRENLRPLFKRFERGEVEEGILEPVVEIVGCAQERRYVDANDGYLRLSIGKAAWPIGVTMVGIHERSAREKLHESDKGAAHIMSDEVTRKFLQGIKRCLSFAQTRWPPDDQLQLMG